MNGKPAARILVLASTYPRHRDDTLPPFVHELARRLVASSEVHVLAPHAAGCATDETMDGVQVHRFRYLPARFESLAYSTGMLPGLRQRPWRALALPFFLGAEWLAALRLLRRKRFDVIHAHWLLPHGLIALMARAYCGYRPALVCTAHGADVYGLQGRVSRRLKRWVVKRAEHVTVVSEAMLRTLREETGDARYSVLPMGVDTRTLFTPAVPPVERRDLLFVGRLAEKKGMRVLLEALASLRDLAGLKLHVIGSGPEETLLKEKSRRLGLQEMVDFEGPVANRGLPAWYRRSALLVFPSVVTAYGDQEGLGLVPVEALACGCAVLASDLPAIRDVIRDGETGRLIRSGDPAALAQALRALLLDEPLRERLAAQGRAYVRQHFDWDVISARYAELFATLSAGV